MEPEAEALPRNEVGDMNVETTPGRTQVLAGSKNVVQLAIRINTPALAQAESSTNPPLHIACVLDCSGSMDGQKLDHAKRAVLKLVKHLSSRDTLHFVTYDTAARIVFQNGDLSDTGKEVLRRHINGVQAMGQTNLCGGLDLAASLLTSHVVDIPSDSVTNSPIRRIFLFSDGHVNVGITEPDEIKRKVAVWADVGIITGSFGIGAGFDEPLMRGIASSGRGRYQFLATAKDIPKLVSKAVHDLIDIYASEAVLDLRGCEHTIVSRVYGGGDDECDDNVVAASAPGLIKLGDIHSDNLRMVLVELDVAPPGNAESGVPFCAAEWVLTCQRKGAPVNLSGEVQLQATRDRIGLEPLAPTVQMAFAIRQATDLEREVAEYLARRERQKAREIKSRQIALLEEALEAGRKQQQDGTSEGAKDMELITVVLERARQVATRLDDENQDEELMARQCWQDRDDFSCASVCDLRNRDNSSCSGSDPPDVANLHDLDSSASSRSSSPASSRSENSPRLPRSLAHRENCRACVSQSFMDRICSMLPIFN